MNRRGFLHTGAVALAASVLRPEGLARAQDVAQAPAPAGTPVRRKLKVDAYSRHLQWLRTPDEVAEATIEMAFTGVDITVRPYPGHIDPARVATDLPPFVKAIRSHGLDVSMITCPITDADSPNAEEMLKTASSLGIKHYWWGTFRYDPKQPIMTQLDALKPRVEKLVALNKKYGMKAMYHTYSIPGTVGENIWDMLHVLRNFDPAYVSLHWDVGHTSVTGGNGTWAQSLMAAGPYIGGVSAKEYTYDLALETPGGGPFTGKPEDIVSRFGRPGGRPGASGPGGPPRAGAPGQTPQQGPPASQAAEQEAGERGMQGPPRRANPPAGGAAPTGQAGLGAQRGPGGRGPGGRAPAGRGGGGQPLPWRTKAVPLGEGINNLPLLGTILRDINFDGPMEIQAEYPNGGAENAQDKITLPRALVLGNMKRDLLTLKAAFQTSGLL